MRADSASSHSLAAAIADGSLIDWTRVDRGTADSTQSGLVQQLRAISNVAGLYRARQTVNASTVQSEPPPPARRAQPASPGTAIGTWGDLVLIEVIGRGSFGKVYRAHDPSLNRAVAVKLLRRTAPNKNALASRLLDEGRILAQVRHPNVVTVYKAEEHDGHVGLLMEFIRGLTLEQMLASHGPFSVGEAGLIGRELCSALAAVHHAGLVHRDVKAANVMREQGGRLVLMDFGAGQKQSVAQARVKGQRRHLVGTPLYMAPELLRGDDATVHSDIFGVGVLLFHLVTNDFPVRAETIEALRAAHARGRVVRLKDARPDVHSTFVRVVERAMHPDPAQRYATAAQMEAALERVRSSTVSVSVPGRVRTSVRGTRNVRNGALALNHEQPSVAVLPFSDMSGAKDQECFCDGVAEELINALTQIPTLRVAARTSAFQFKGHACDVRQIGAALNVATVLDGSVRRDGDRLRVTVELIGVRDGYQLWSHRFDRKLEDVFSVQDEIAAAVVGTLKGRLAAGERRAVVAPRSRDLEAYRWYLEGRYYWNKRTEAELKRSVGFFQHAIERDPAFAKAHAAMADAYVTLGTYGATPAKDVMPRAKRAVEEALALDSELAEAYACRGSVRSVYEWSWADAERDFRQALELKPSYATAHHWYAMNLLVPLGRTAEAADALNCALDLDPLALVIRTSVGMASYFAGQYDEAARDLSKTIELDGGFGMAHFFLGATYTEQARYGAARRHLDTAMRLSGRTPEMLAALGYLNGVSGNARAARQVLKELGQLARVRYVSPARLAEVHAGLDERRLALDRLEEACVERAADLAWIGVRPTFARLRKEARFGELLKRMNV